MLVDVGVAGDVDDAGERCLVAVGHVGVHGEDPVHARLGLSLQFVDRNRVAAPQRAATSGRAPGAFVARPRGFEPLTFGSVVGYLQGFSPWLLGIGSGLIGFWGVVSAEFGTWFGTWLAHARVDPAGGPRGLCELGLSLSGFVAPIPATRLALRDERVSPPTTAPVLGRPSSKLGERVRRDINGSSAPQSLGVVADVGLKPEVVRRTVRDSVPAGTSQKISHLYKRMELAVLVDRAAHEPGRSFADVRLTSREVPVEAVGHEIVRAPERSILAIDDCERQPWPRRSRSLDQQAVGHPVPQVVNLERSVRGHADSQNAHFADAGDVLERRAEEVMPGRLRRHRRPAASKQPLLGMKRDALALDELAPFDFTAAGAAA